jgi:oorB subunit of 2-oxoglutarate:acceptor oxidoreductase
VTAQYGNVDPSFDACELAIAAGASFVARESVINPERLTKLFVEGFKHDGYSFFDVFSNCHVNLGRKNKMGEATQNLEWIKSRLANKAKFDAMSEDERAGLFPAGVLHQSERTEYTKAYARVIAAAKNGEKIDFGELK